MAGQLPYSLDPLQQALAQAAAAASLSGHGNLNPQTQAQTQTQHQHHQIHSQPHHQHQNSHSLHYQHILQQLPPSASSASTSKRDVGAGISGAADQRLPQWTYQETTDFIAIRASLEDDFIHTKRNKVLWETVSARMKEKGYNRSAEQCKCKWKNLVMRYKEKDAMEVDDGRQCPFYDELHAVFADQRDKKAADRLSVDSDLKTKKKSRSHGDDYSDEENGLDDIDESDGEHAAAARLNKKRKMDRERQKVNVEKCRANRMQEVLEEFFQQHERMEMMWREAMERREEQRRLREQEFRQAMEKLEAERMAKEQQWREREEQRRIREEARAEKRDALLTAILHRLASRNDNLQ